VCALFAEMLVTVLAGEDMQAHSMAIRASGFPGWINFTCVMKLSNWQKSWLDIEQVNTRSSQKRRISGLAAFFMPVARILINPTLLTEIY
jgi:hypothetical protein